MFQSLRIQKEKLISQSIAKCRKSSWDPLSPAGLECPGSETKAPERETDDLLTWYGLNPLDMLDLIDWYSRFY